jgi:hypothetical protein
MKTAHRACSSKPDHAPQKHGTEALHVSLRLTAQVYNMIRSTHPNLGIAGRSSYQQLGQGSGMNYQNLP